MGMFDELFCDAALPDGDYLPGTCFQTKSFPSPCMFRYRITSEGRLMDSDGNDIEPDGYITFYTTERADREGTAHERISALREYRARFAFGQLQGIVRVDSKGEDNLRYGLASFRWFETRSFMFGDADDDRT
jgi:hypothetical protein